MNTSLDCPRVIGHADGSVHGAEQEGQIGGAVDVHERREAADDEGGLVLRRVVEPVRHRSHRVPRREIQRLL